MERIAPGRRRLPGGHAEREPARRRRRPARRCALLDDARLRCAWPPRPRRSPTGCARPPRATGPVQVRQRARPADGLLQRRAGARLRGRAGLRPRGATPPGAARCWRAASTRRRRSSRPGSPRSPTPPSTSSARSRPRRPRSPRSRRDGARAGPAPARRGAARRGRPAGAGAAPSPTAPRPLGALAAAGPRAAGHEASSRWSSRRSARATCCTTARPRVVARRRPRPGAAGRRPALRARPRAAGRARRPRRRRASSPTSSRCARRRTPRADDELADAVWEAGAAAVGWGPTASSQAAKAHARAGARTPPARCEPPRASSRRRGARAVADRRGGPGPLVDLSAA